MWEEPEQHYPHSPVKGSPGSSAEEALGFVNGASAAGTGGCTAEPDQSPASPRALPALLLTAQGCGDAFRSHLKQRLERIRE